MVRTSRRQVLAGCLSSGTALLAGCAAGSGDATTETPAETPTGYCIAETHPLLEIRTTVTGVSYENEYWTVETETTARFEYARDGSMGLRNVEVAAYDAEENYLVGREIQDLVWSAVPDEDWTTSTIECERGQPTYHHGEMTVRTTVTSDHFPVWVAIRFEDLQANLAHIQGSYYSGNRADQEASAGEYDVRRVPDALQLPLRERRERERERTTTATATPTRSANETVDTDTEG